MGHVNSIRASVAIVVLGLLALILPGSCARRRRSPGVLLPR